MKPGGLVEPGVTHYAKEDFIRNPQGKNQWVMRTDEEIQKIIDNPQYEGWTKKDFRNKEILTRVETDREGLKFPHEGKTADPDKVRKAQTKRTDWIKEWSNYTTEQKLAAMRESGLELSHIGGKADLVTLNNLAYLPKYTNKLSYFRFEKILNGIQADQNKILADTTMSVTDQRAALAELAKADRTLRKRFKGQGFDKIKSRIKTREFAGGMGKKEVIIDPSITIGKGEAGANIPLKTASTTEKSKMVALGKENIKAQIKLLKRIGYGKNCKASGGRVGFADAGAVTGELKCIMNDVNKTKADLNSSNPEVRRLAVLKNKKATQVAEKIPEMLKILRRGTQRGMAAISSIIGGYGGLALEAVAEGMVFEWYKRKGYKDEHAYAETFTPRLLAEGVAGKSTKDVPWYGGAEQLLEKELYQLKGTEKENLGKVIGERTAVKRYIDNEKALADAESKYLQLDTDYQTARKGTGVLGEGMALPEKGMDEQYKKAMEDTLQEINSLEDQLDLDRDTYNAAKEKQETEMGVRAIEYGEYGKGDTPKLAKEREERRHKEFLDYRKGKQRSFYLPKGKLQERVEDPLAKKPYTFLETDETLPAFSLEPGMRFLWEDIPRYKGDEGKKRKWQNIYDAGGWDLMDKIGIAGGVANMAEGGIASLKKK
jgi:hypothetical protein